MCWMNEEKESNESHCEFILLIYFENVLLGIFKVGYLSLTKI